MRVARLVLSLVGVLSLVNACGGKPAVADPLREAGQRHCSSHQDCASGYCSSDGRCG